MEQEPKIKEIEISLKNNSEREQITYKLLNQILGEYSLEKWILCRKVTIEEDAGGKAFPFIRLSTWRDAEGLMAQFLHEQIHWIEVGKEDQMSNAIKELKILFPNAPVDRPEGADSEESTYCHLIVCRLELLALSELLGEEKAKEIVQGNKNYTWIRKMVINNGAKIDLIIKKYFPDRI